MRRLSALLAVVVAVGLVADADARPRRRRGGRGGSGAKEKSLGPGEVQFRSATTAYLDRGTADGLKQGQELSFTRNGRAIGKCTVATAAEHFATCDGGALQEGDRFDVKRVVVPPPSAPEPLPTERELLRRNARLAEQQHALVEADAEGSVALRGVRRVSAALSHTSFANVSGAGPFHIQRLDLNVDGLPVWKGLSVSADVSVLSFATRPSNFRSALRSSPSLLVRQLQVDWRTDSMPLSGSLGRVWTRHTPGLFVIDGVQGSWRTKSENVEVGAYAGFLPDAMTLGVALDQGTVGGWVTTRFQSGERADANLLELEARLGYAGKQLMGGRLEAGLAAHAYRGRTLDAHAQVEVGVGGGQGAAAIDAGRLDLGVRPNPNTRLWLSGRYRGASPTGVVELGATAPGQRAVHADGGAQWEATSKLWFAVVASVGTDLDNNLLHVSAGPEVSFPELFGRTGGLTLGYREDVGWLWARQAWGQFVLNFMRRVRLLARPSLSWQVSAGSSSGLAGQEAGLTLALDVTLPWSLWVRVGATGRLQADDLLNESVEPKRMSGLATAQLGGSF